MLKIFLMFIKKGGFEKYYYKWNLLMGWYLCIYSVVEILGCWRFCVVLIDIILFINVVFVMIVF